LLRKIIIATRRSALALTQTRWVAARLGRLHPGLDIDLLELTTSGDRLTHRSDFGGKGLFIKELEEALARNDANIAVHSLKDMPMQLSLGFVLAAIPEREDARDAFISNRYESLAKMPERATVGTSSLRRQSVIRARFSNLDVVPLRGNVDTRLKKLDRDDYDAIVLAAAGMKRLGLDDRITALIAVEDCIPAPGQGALAIETREDAGDAIALAAPLNDAATEACVTAERAFSAALSGDCNIPLGAHAQILGNEIVLRAFVGTPDGAEMIEGEQRGSADDAATLGRELAKALRAKGADRILAALRKDDG
jgi:hydroxymethylbilane synthase